MKTKEQKWAWTELLKLTYDPNWDQLPEKVKRHQKLMDILHGEEPEPADHDERIQRYLDKRPGMEKDILTMLEEKWKLAEIKRIYPIDGKVFAYVRRKYGVENSIKLHLPERTKVEESYKKYGVRGAAKEFGVSDTTLRVWLRKYDIPKNRRRSERTKST
ncbi:hypothetical protein [Candidatus Enterococcus ferrettii]|uniref:Transposase n=1 Tax=Candidatus Enterococcus ferrettii TaxID=2815324 RepID=A0ABV0EWC8_9ENTE|nr:hypothetical protein [Enterococcus sp. 665A]MBO1342109.1 hypothetical protein [Enterococcus sp. 665A]